MRRLRYLLTSADTDLLELFMSALMVVFGSVLLNPWWRTFHAVQSFRLLAAWGVPEWAFGGVYALAGVAGLWALARGGLRWRRELAAARGGLRWRRELAAARCVLWVALGAALLITNHEATGGYTYLLCGLSCGLCFLRLSYDTHQAVG